jgi:glutamate synthase (NADPH/NADH) small chain
MDYLYDRAREIAAEVGTAGELAPPSEQPITAAGKHVIVIGGGDTGADCVANAHRENAASVTQIEVLGEPPARRPDDLTPWPQWPMKLRTSYALKEGGDRDFAISTTHLSGSNGSVEHIHWAQNDGAPPFAPLPGTEDSHPAELVLLAMGFLHPEPLLLEQLGVERDNRGNAAAPGYATSVEGVFAAGDARRGQSLVVWAINEGRLCAEQVDKWLNERVR